MMALRAIPRMPGGAPPAAQRSALRESRAPAVILRRAVVGASLVGMASMAMVALFQTGLKRHLADPPLV